MKSPLMKDAELFLMQVISSKGMARKLLAVVLGTQEVATLLYVSQTNHILF
jgi:hypothetical protein